ncbi:MULTISPECIES: DUF1643 domain-containing protein [unclassified Prochlorococcus]|uniref:DUF1643 domain-containing protein n=1 Tax=unclassified Prochlorococcus TaxID=2627481 RepID=UPI0005336E9B|nr:MULTISPECIES: DUF1643 domain-containing protein [unclassified Prochlorococcus]KGG16182.1 hypothetical protein EV07_1348 [Prochlorococcus sp. MIT 0603]KGG18083.1 hypothetical protein EV06_0212 [Prochlorococcus sp. MIT 0602]
MKIIKSTASFSICKKYRLRLTKRISKSSREIIFIGLNPSTANSIYNDATLSRLLDFTSIWGYGSLEVINLFARVSKNPVLLKTCKDPIGEGNDLELKKRMRSWSENLYSDLWLGWGVNGRFMNRDIDVLGVIKKFYSKRHEKYPYASKPLSLGRTKGGYPRHPLYVAKKEILRPFC